jgi:hemerythrin-like domain-containing protein
MATALMMSHHGLRRDLARFLSALQKVSSGDTSKVEALRDEWKNYRDTLHGHHDAEDTRMFPYLRGQHPGLAGVIERLGADHRQIDPLLERGDRAFAELPETAAAKSVLRELAALLDAHLETEEGSVIPHLRDAKGFPPPASDEEAALYAQGFAWSSQGIAPEVLDPVYAMLPENLRSRMPAARAAFDERCVRVWGTADAGASRTSVPDR